MNYINELINIEKIFKKDYFFKELWKQFLWEKIMTVSRKWAIDKKGDNHNWLNFISDLDNKKNNYSYRLVTSEEIMVIANRRVDDFMNHYKEKKLVNHFHNYNLLKNCIKQILISLIDKVLDEVLSELFELLSINWKV